MVKHDAIKIIRFSILSIFFLIIIFYAFFRSKDLIFGVKIRNVNIQVISTGGRVMQQMQQSLKIGSNNNSIQIQDGLAKGVIYLKFSADGFQETVPVVKQ